MASQNMVIALLAISAIALLIAFDAYILFPIQPPLRVEVPVELEPNIEITIYGGRTPDGKFGFGFSPDNLTSPGPVLRFKVGDVVRIRFINVGKIHHSFAIVQEVSEEPLILFNSEIGTSNNPIAPGEDGSVIVKFNRPGTFKYMCTVPGHAQAGMWGEIIIEG